MRELDGRGCITRKTNSAGFLDSDRVKSLDVPQNGTFWQRTNRSV